MFNQLALQANHIGDGDEWEIHAERLAGRGVRGAGTGGAAAAAQNVRADNEVLVGVEGLARPDHVFPPTGASVVVTDAGGVSVAREGMHDEDGV